MAHIIGDCETGRILGKQRGRLIGKHGLESCQFPDKQTLQLIAPGIIARVFQPVSKPRNIFPGDEFFYIRLRHDRRSLYGAQQTRFNSAVGSRSVQHGPMNDNGDSVLSFLSGTLPARPWRGRNREGVATTFR
jgi:hypothetical protein